MMDRLVRFRHTVPNDFFYLWRNCFFDYSVVIKDVNQIKFDTKLLACSKINKP